MLLGVILIYVFKILSWSAADNEHWSADEVDIFVHMGL